MAAISFPGLAGMANPQPSATDMIEYCRKKRSEDIIQSVGSVGLELCLLVALSHGLHQLLLRRLGQPSIVSQMLAGLLVGKSFAEKLFSGKPGDDDRLTSTATLCRMLFMFFAGLELDPPYLLRSARRAAAVGFSGMGACCAVAVAAAPLVYRLTRETGSEPLFALALALVLSSTASPVVIRVAVELKLMTTEAGRVLVASALLNDAACLIVVAAASVFVPAGAMGAPSASSLGGRLMNGAMAVGMIGGSVWLVRPMARWMNRRNRDRGEVSGVELAGVLLFVLLVSCVTELMGYNSMMASFLIGLLFPRTGATVRTVTGSLSYFVHNIVVPIYFAYAGVQTDLNVLREGGHVVATVVVLIFMGTAGKIAGSMFGATWMLGMSRREGLVLGLLLSVKGHVDMIIIAIARKYGIWGHATYMTLLMAVLLSNMIAGPAAAFLIRQERKAQRYRSLGIQWLGPGSELRILACLHSPLDAPTMLNLIELSSGAVTVGPIHRFYSRSPVAAYLLHLVELTHRISATALYHQREGDRRGVVGGDGSLQISLAADAFAEQTGIALRQIESVSSYDTMHRDVFHAAQDVRASVVILPCCRRLRLDGRLGVGKDGIRRLNGRVLQRAPCTVAVLVDRGGVNFPIAVVDHSPEHRVAVAFFGGADDREAAAYGGRLAMHSCVSVTVFRFVAAGGGTEEEEEDVAFVREFEGRFVESGMVRWVERVVGWAKEAVEMMVWGEKYSLYVMGRGRGWTWPKEDHRWASDTSAAGDKEELGEIAAMMLSPDYFMSSSGSLLVMQQHRVMME